MELSLFDLHCDTPYLMLRNSQPLFCNNLAVSLENARNFNRYTQVMALWTDNELTNEEGWVQLHRMLENLKSDPALQDGRARLCTAAEDRVGDSASLFLGVEDARLLNGRLERVDELNRLGVRILTPLWSGLTCIGGSHNTDEGLTDFGCAALCRAAELGMLLDISHASERSAKQILAISEQHRRPVIASHSNAYSVCPVSRNLKEEQIDRIVKSGGLIGLNFYGAFLTREKDPSIESILLHIDHFLSRGAESVLALGGDMDGCDLPRDMKTLASLPHLAERMLQHGYTEALIHKIFYQNANAFFMKYL